MIHAFVVGCPRSGTTWLQMLLAQHPAVATTQETHLFDGYIAQLEDAWTRDKMTPRGIGLQAALTQAQFDELCTDIARRVLAEIARRIDGASVVLEKTPAHVRVAPLIVKLLPQARFVHLVRDPRAAVASLCAAGRSWGRAWASSDPAENARLWVSDVSAGRQITDLTEHLCTLRYEDLAGKQGWLALQELYAWLGLDAGDDFCRQVLADCAIDRLRNHSESLRAAQVIGDDPAGFYRKGKADAWRDELSRKDVRIVEYIAGDLMREYGYTPTTVPARLAHKPLRLKRHELLDGLEWRVRHAVSRGFDATRRLL